MLVNGSFSVCPCFQSLHYAKLCSCWSLLHSHHSINLHLTLGKKANKHTVFPKKCQTSPSKLFFRGCFNCRVWIWKTKNPNKKTESLKLPYHIIKTEIYFSIISNSSSCLRNCSRPDRRLSMHSILSAYFPECQLNWTDEGNMALKEEGPWHKSHS